ncbi:MAG: ChbG/HpnK family deacetylase [Lachnospiraceae bacterium]|nr:ChbG/HpnK family deacetylase [Lachnospiraceae bacterium]
MLKTDIHADDYALTVNTSKDMLSCMLQGQLDSISVVPNMSCFQECMELFYQAIPEMPFLPKISVHLDFVEGHCLAPAGEVPLLVKDGSSLMGLAWGGLFARSYLPWKRRAAKAQLKKEIKTQIERVQGAVRQAMDIAKAHGVPGSQERIRIDSHQHAHMIPVVWEALTEVIAEEHYQVEYIRNSKETLGVFVSETSLWKTYRPVNFIKNRLLSLYSHKADRYMRAHHMEQMYLWGLVMSGHMDYDRIVRLFPKYAALAEKKGRTLEILFHPGLTISDEVTEEIGEEAARDFYLRQDRHVEMEAVGKMEALISRTACG